MQGARPPLLAPPGPIHRAGRGQRCSCQGPWLQRLVAATVRACERCVACGVCMPCTAWEVLTCVRVCATAVRAAPTCKKLNGTRGRSCAAATRCSWYSNATLCAWQCSRLALLRGRASLSHASLPMAPRRHGRRRHSLHSRRQVAGILLAWTALETAARRPRHRRCLQHISRGKLAAAQLPGQ